MGRKSTYLASGLIEAIHEELRALIGRRSYSQRALADLSGVSQSVISKTIFRSESTLNLSQFETICEVLGDSPAEVMLRAERAVQAAEREEALRAQLDAPENYDLAAQKKRQLRPGEEAGIEYFD